MKKFRFLLLDAGPIIKLFQLGIWDEFIKRCDVTISGTIAAEAKWASQEFEDGRIDLDSYAKQGLIKIVDVELSLVKAFHDRFKPAYKESIHDGEKETLAFMHNSSEDWKVCSADRAVFQVLGSVRKGEQGISLEKILKDIGLPQSNLEWKYTERFREKYTKMGQIDSIQGQGLQ